MFVSQLGCTKSSVHFLEVKEKSFCQQLSPHQPRLGNLYKRKCSNVRDLVSISGEQQRNHKEMEWISKAVAAQC